MLAPSPDHYIRFPDDFGRRVVVFVDTEEEFDWTQPKRRDAVSVSAVQTLPVAHRHLRSFGLNPVYLADHPVASTPASAAVLRGLVEAGEAEIGAQLHPWVNPPFDEAVAPVNSFPGNLPRALEHAKLRALTETLESAIGMRPLVYRAGRYGIGPNTESILDELGYRLDVSVRPLFDYRDEGGPNFTRLRAQAYWTGPERRLLELPLTSTYTGLLRRSGRAMFEATAPMPWLRGLLAHARLLERVALTPEGIPLADALRALDVLLDSDLQVFSISFHSPSVVPGHTPYVRDAADLTRFYAWWDGVLGRLLKRGVRPVSVGELLAAAWGTR